MAFEQKQARILTKCEQKRSIRGIQKPKKNIIKNCLESPFALEWPKLTSEDEKEITALLQKSCLGLRKLECKPPWKQVAKYKGEERKSFLKEYYNKFQENLDPDGIKQNNKREEALSHLIFGYNAVMRAMEQDRVAGIILKKNIEPTFVTKTFLPGCAKKCIPLIPLNDLDRILKDKDTLAISHACMVLGLKPSVREESNRFYPLFTKMCEVVGVEELYEDSNGEEDDCLERSAIDDGERECSKFPYQLSEMEIGSYHLKRNGSKGRRAFIPGASEMQVKKSNFGADFLSLGSMETHHCALKTQAHDTKSDKILENKSENLKGKPTVEENTDFSAMILIDASGDEKPATKNCRQKRKISLVEKSAKGDLHKTKQRAKKLHYDSYVPAKTKRLMGNPNRKSMGAKTKRLMGNPNRKSKSMKY